MSLAARCSSNFSTGIRSRGLMYFNSNAVRLDDADDVGASFLVKGTDIKPYEVDIDWAGESPDSIRAACSCPYYASDGLCKHIWAALLTCDKHGLEKYVPGRQLLEVETDQMDAYWDEDQDVVEDEFDEDNSVQASGSPLLTGRPTTPIHNRKKTAPKRAPTNAWRSQLKKLGESMHGSSASTPRTASVPAGPVEAWYVLDLEATRKWGLPIIVFHQRTTKKNGELGKIKKVSVNHEEVASFPLPEDRQLMDLLFGVDRYALDNVFGGYYSGSYVGTSYTKRSHGTVVQAMFQEILPRLCATGRLAWLPTTTQRAEIEGAAKLNWDNDAAWKAGALGQKSQGKKFSSGWRILSR